MFADNTMDSLIYPRLKLKSEVISKVVDGGQVSWFQINEVSKLSGSKLAESI